MPCVTPTPTQAEPIASPPSPWTHCRDQERDESFVTIRVRHGTPFARPSVSLRRSWHSGLRVSMHHRASIADGFAAEMPIVRVRPITLLTHHRASVSDRFGFATQIVTLGSSHLACVTVPHLSGLTHRAGRIRSSGGTGPAGTSA